MHQEPVQPDRAPPCWRGACASGDAPAVDDVPKAAVPAEAAQGVNPQRMRTISYGKERPVAVCNDISCWSQNRRVEIVYTAR